MKMMDKEDIEESQLDDSEASEKSQPWIQQITIRGIVVSTIVGGIYSVIAMKLGLTTGLIPHFNLSAALLAYVLMKAWLKTLQKAGFITRPFTPQENTMIQTCAVACYSIAVGGGFGTYLLALNRKSYELTGGPSQGISPKDIKEPGIAWMTAFLFLISFVGLFVLVPLRKAMIVDMKLIFPSGLTTAVLINGFHAGNGKTAKEQIKGFMRYFSFSFFWAFFKWFYDGKAAFCGFSTFPSLGLQAMKQTFFFDFNSTFVGAGMIVPYSVSLSMMAGAILCYVILLPIISQFKGDWYPEALKENSMKSINGYKTFIPIALILGDGLYNFFKMISIAAVNVHKRMTHKQLNSTEEQPLPGLAEKKTSLELKQDELFLRERIPLWLGVTGYVAFSILSIIMVPVMFPQLERKYVVIAYILAPALAFCNAYGAGLTDINMSFNYGKVALFLIAAMSGKDKDGSVVAALVACGLVKSVISVACDLMQDFKTGHLTLSSPKAMFVSQIIGTVIGCVMAPLTFLLFYKAFDIGNQEGEYKAPMALMIRNMAIIGVQGFSVLPKYCLQFFYAFLAMAIMMNLVRDMDPRRIGKWMPIPMAMAVPFIIGAFFAVDMCVGSLIVFLWHRSNAKKAEYMIPAVASGLICGEGLWSLPAALLSLAKIYPPMCMKVLPS